jgi:hypothetical protein
MDRSATIAPMSDRSAAFLARLAHLDVDDLQVLALAPSDPMEHEALVERAVAAAEAAGRGPELEETVEQARDGIVRAFSRRGYDPTWFGLNWGRALARPDDRVALVEAVEDAAIAAAVADLVPDDAAALAERFELAASMAGTAPSANPHSSTHRNTVRASWVFGAWTWLLAFGIGIVTIATLIVLGSNP